jgi:hypothetical protein
MKTAIAVVTLLIATLAYASTTYMPRAETEKCIVGIEKQIIIIDKKLDMILEHIMNK